MAKFEVFEVSLELIAALRPVADQLLKQDCDLVAQLKRSASSISLNISKGSQRSGRDRVHHYRIAAGSAAETLAALKVAQAWG